MIRLLANKNWVGLDILHQMQGMYEATWQQSFAWGGPQGPQSLQPAKRDPHTIASEQYLNKAGRTTAKQFHKVWQSKPSLIFDAMPIEGEGHVQTTAMPKTLMRRDAEGMYAFRTDDAGNIDNTFCVEDARAGIELLFLHGEDLRSRLHHHGLLQKVPAGEDIADERRIIDVFIKIAYVITCDSLGKRISEDSRTRGSKTMRKAGDCAPANGMAATQGASIETRQTFYRHPFVQFRKLWQSHPTLQLPKEDERQEVGGLHCQPSGEGGQSHVPPPPLPATKAAGQKRVSSKTVSKRGASTDQSGATRPCKKPRSGA